MGKMASCVRRLVLLVLIACAHGIQRLEGSEAADKISDGTFDVIIDTRGDEAYEKGHVKGAVQWSKAKSSMEGCEKRRVAFYCRPRTSASTLKTKPHPDEAQHGLEQAKVTHTKVVEV